MEGRESRNNNIKLIKFYKHNLDVLIISITDPSWDVNVNLHKEIGIAVSVYESEYKEHFQFLDQ